MSECTHNCSTCSSDCSSRTEPAKDALNQMSSVKKVIGVISGKGGVGKSLVTSMLAVLSQRNGTAQLCWTLTLQAHPSARLLACTKKCLATKWAFCQTSAKQAFSL